LNLEARRRMEDLVGIEVEHEALAVLELLELLLAGQIVLQTHHCDLQSGLIIFGINGVYAKVNFALI